MINQENATKKSPRILTGKVVSNKMDKTINVLIERKIKHKKYKKYINRNSKIFAHDENNSCKEGDFVVIKEGRPLSKNKTWVLEKIIDSNK